MVCVGLLEAVVSVEQHPELQDFGKNRAALPVLTSNQNFIDKETPHPLDPTPDVQKPVKNVLSH